jgi:DMSO/TMAO reductase YedYZ molybdopterin-dependent catalytic subunit
VSTNAALPRQARPARTGVPLGFAALIGLLAVGAALGSGQLVAALLSPSSSPFFAVGNTVINYSPETVTEFAKIYLGTNDKPILLSGMAVVIALVAVVAGLLSRRRPGPGLTVVAALGVAGLLAVVLSPVFSPVDLAAPVASLVVGLAVFAGLHRLAVRAYEPGAPVTTPRPDSHDVGDDAGDDAGDDVSRRTVLIGSSVAVGVASLAAGGGGLLLGGGQGAISSRNEVTAQLRAATLAERAPAVPADAAFPDLGTPTFITANPDFYRIDVALQIPSQTAKDWRLRIHGMVDREITLSFEDLLRRPLVERTLTLTCVSNPVGGNLISTATFIGVELRPILLEAGIQPGAEQLHTTSIDGWTAGTPTDVVMEPDRGALLAIGMNGEALPAEHGFPVRMIVPGLYGYVSGTKWIADMNVTTFAAQQSYWQQRGWSQQAPIKTECRIDRPQGFASLPAGRVTCAGIAWSQPTGISKVEVRMDGGPWQVAQLATGVSGRTWRMWRTDFTLAPGSHTVQTRATDLDGVTQTEARADPIPNGASAWPATIFTVT